MPSLPVLSKVRRLADRRSSATSHGPSERSEKDATERRWLASEFTGIPTVHCDKLSNVADSSIRRDEHCGPVPDSAWAADGDTRRSKGRVQIFNATRPGGLDGWTMDAAQYELLRSHILDMIDDEAGSDGTITLKNVVNVAQDRFCRR